MTTPDTSTEAVEAIARHIAEDGWPKTAAAITALVAERDALRLHNEELDYLHNEVGSESIAALEARAARADALEAEVQRLRKAGEALIEIVEGVSVIMHHGEWVSARHNQRLKDTQGWVRFYVAHRAALTTQPEEKKA